jgi:outer membrane protein OmpA-like peptidoglycan-associated protein
VIAGDIHDAAATSDLAAIRSSVAALEGVIANATRSGGGIDVEPIWYPASWDPPNDYEKIIVRYAPGDTAFLALQRLIAPSLAARDWTAAARTITRFSDLFKGRRSVTQLLEMLGAPVRSLVVSNLGAGINTAGSEFYPVPTADGKWLYFNGRWREDSVGGEDIYVAMSYEGAWQTAGTLTTINSLGNEDVLSISTDGNRLFFFSDQDEGLGGGDIFHATRTRSGWSALQHLPPPINSPNWEADGLMTSDGRAILFVSDRPGGIGRSRPKDSQGMHSFWGNTDIYACMKTDTGWSAPVNLGPMINTPYAERTPFLHPDGKTLYFSSEGHYGMGDMDLFRSVRLREDSWTEWSEPVNLGKEINTIHDDMGYKVTTAGDIAYFGASDRTGGFGRTDLYSVAIPSEMRPDPVASISGRITDGNDRPVVATIRWQDLATGRLLGELTNSPRDGSYFIVLPLGRNYGFFTDVKGYYPASKNIDLKERTTADSLTENITLVSIEDNSGRDAVVRLNNLFFEHNRFDLKPESYPELARLAAILKETPGLGAEIMGHTDDQGDDAYNLALSEKRARAVLEYLVTLGCARARLSARGYGESKPTVANDSDENRARNRRVEARLVR